MLYQASVKAFAFVNAIVLFGQFRGDVDELSPTNLRPRCSKRVMMLPMSPRWTPSGLTIINVRSIKLSIAP